MLYVELDAAGNTRHLHYAPYLDYRPLQQEEPSVQSILDRPESKWITRELEQKAQGHAVAHVVPEHLKEVRDRRLAWIEKTRAAVKDRLTKEIGYWDHRAEELKLQERAGKANARLNSPVVLGGLVVVPMGLLGAITGRPPSSPTTPVDTQAASARARAIVMEVERRLGYSPIDREHDKLGYDIESRDPRKGKLRFLEVKGRVTGAETITVTKNEILYSLNKPDDFILAIVEFREGDTHRVHYVCQPFRREPDFGVTSVNYSFAELLARAEAPR
jgi:hypothetical protein